MGTARRFVSDESGVTLPLVMMMVVLIGVMGAGILTFVSSDLNIVVEENRGQRAFQVADAGIEAAKRQLASNVERGLYDDTSATVFVGAEDIRWSKAKGGLTLNNLDGDATTSDSVNVTIEYRGSTTDDFRVVSTGTYGDLPQQAMRRIEASFKGVSAGAGTGQTIGHPIYYTPSSIKIMSDGSNPVTLTQVSLFSRQDILIQSVQAYPIRNTSEFRDDFSAQNSGAIRISGSDALCDWNSKIPINPQICFKDGTTGNWNTEGRTTQDPGMAAEGKICSFGYLSATTSLPTSADAGLCSPSASSIADGVRGFDSTTTPRFVTKDCQINNLPTCPDNAPQTLSPPFPLPKPIPSGLKSAACDSTEVAENKCNYSPNTVSYFPEGTPSSTWGLGNSNQSSTNKVAFIDAQNKTLTFNPGGGKYKGIIVVWCGRLEMADSFEGIILNLIGNNLPGNTQCNRDTLTKNATTNLADGKTVGTYENLGKQCQCWVYAEGGAFPGSTTTIPGIQLDINSTLVFRPSADWNFQDGLFVGPPPTNFKLRNWRELYQASP